MVVIDEETAVNDGKYALGAGISVNAGAAPKVGGLLADAAMLRIASSELPGGAVAIDAGVNAPGGLEAGRRIAEICMGGLGRVALVANDAAWPLAVSVTCAEPVIACLGSQYAGWSLAAGEGKGRFQALGSGPARAIAQKEPLFAELGYRDHAAATSLVLEVDRPPPPEIVEKVARDCAVAPAGLTFILTPTTSLAGLVQIVARVVEVALHKAHALGFPLDAIRDAAGSAPVPPPSRDFLAAMGRSNDAILFAGVVQLYVDGDDARAEDLAQRLPSRASRDYGKPFARVFKDSGYDFYKIDPHLFAPAAVVVTNVTTGRTFRGGAVDAALLAQSFEG